ncbi:type II toxin-antitoxin system VapC family toxin [Agromyces chitinivorans]|uniref:type II toxin-antitoxin system VapC family toxin n=1 Tax=Agromyces chitinivorans TaxID=3158560 RepID=UPI00339A4442
MIVVDASVVVEALVGAARADATRARLAADELWAPDLLDVEVASALRGLRLAGRISDARLDRAVDDLARLRVERHPSAPLVRAALGHRDNLTTYDAMYVALAEVLGCALFTGDRRLAAASGIDCEVELLA